MKLNLSRPLVFFDLETTGINPSTDRIIEICCVKIHPDGSESIYRQRVNPGMPIPANSTEVHHITDEDVRDCPSFKEIAVEVREYLDESDLAGFNSNKFDVPLLQSEFARAGVQFSIDGRSLVDVQTIYHKLEQRNLSAAYRFYCGKELEAAHSAEADARATYEVLLAQLERYPESEDFGNDIAKLARFSQHGTNVDLAGRFMRDKEGRVVVNFGKYKGKVLQEVFRRDPSYYQWMMQGDFAKNTKDVLMQEYMKFKKSKG